MKGNENYTQYLEFLNILMKTATYICNFTVATCATKPFELKSMEDICDHKAPSLATDCRLNVSLNFDWTISTSKHALL